MTAGQRIICDFLNVWASLLIMVDMDRPDATNTRGNSAMLSTDSRAIYARHTHKHID